MISKLRIISADLSTVLDLRRLLYIYQQLYHAFYRKPIHHQEGMDGDGRSTKLGKEKGEAQAVYLKVTKAAVGVIKEDAD